MDNAFDPVKLQFWLDAAAITKQQSDEFKFVSELMIKAGRVERLDQKAMVQAVDRLAYEIAKLSFETAIAYPGLTNDQIQEIPAVAEQTNKLDEIMLTISFGSGIHKAIIDVLVGERCDVHTQAFAEKLPLLIK